MFRLLDKQPFANSLEVLQEQVDRFDEIYSTERPHQALPGRITPQEAWEATLKVALPRPTPRPAQALPDGLRMTRIRDTGTVFRFGTRFHVSRPLAGNLANLVIEVSPLVFSDQGTLLIEHPRPVPGTKYVGNGRPRGPQRPRRNRRVSGMS